MMHKTLLILICLVLYISTSPSGHAMVSGGNQGNGGGNQRKMRARGKPRGKGLRNRMRMNTKSGGQAPPPKAAEGEPENPDNDGKKPKNDWKTALRRLHKKVKDIKGKIVRNLRPGKGTWGSRWKFAAAQGEPQNDDKPKKKFDLETLFRGLHQGVRSFYGNVRKHLRGGWKGWSAQEELENLDDADFDEQNIDFDAAQAALEAMDNQLDDMMNMADDEQYDAAQGEPNNMDGNKKPNDWKTAFRTLHGHVKKFFGSLKARLRGIGKNRNNKPKNAEQDDENMDYEEYDDVDAAQSEPENDDKPQKKMDLETLFRGIHQGVRSVTGNVQKHLRGGWRWAADQNDDENMDDEEYEDAAQSEPQNDDKPKKKKNDLETLFRGIHQNVRSVTGNVVKHLRPGRGSWGWAADQNDENMDDEEYDDVDAAQSEPQNNDKPKKKKNDLETLFRGIHQGVRSFTGNVHKHLRGGWRWAADQNDENVDDEQSDDVDAAQSEPQNDDKPKKKNDLETLFRGIHQNVRSFTGNVAKHLRGHKGWRWAAAQNDDEENMDEEAVDDIMNKNEQPLSSKPDEFMIRLTATDLLIIGLLMVNVVVIGVTVFMCSQKRHKTSKKIVVFDDESDDEEIGFVAN